VNIGQGLIALVLLSVVVLAYNYFYSRNRNGR